MHLLEPDLKTQSCNLQPVGSRTIRVLHYVAYYQRMAGSNRGTFELITHLPKNVTSLVVFAGEGIAPEAYRKAGIEVAVMPPGLSLNQFGKVMLQWSLLKQVQVAITELLPYTLQLQKLIREFRPDLIHIDSSRAAILIGPAARLTSCPIVGHLHGALPFGGISQTIFETVSDRIITVCSAIQSDLSPPARRKAVTVYYGIQPIPTQPRSIPWLKALKAAGKLIVSCFASVVPFKGHHHLLTAVAELNRRGWQDRVVFFCVGDLEAEYQEHSSWLMQRQRELGIDNLTFTGWQSNPVPFYQLADIEVLPSVRAEQLNYGHKVIDVRGNEGFPYTHLEAMYFGLPVVGTDIAGVREQIADGVTGFLVPPSDPMALADALEKLLINTDLRSRMGQAGRERVQQQFSTDAYVSGVMQVYRSLLTKKTDSSSEPCLPKL